MQKKWEGGRLGPPRGGGTRPGSRGPHPPAAPSVPSDPAERTRSVPKRSQSAG